MFDVRNTVYQFVEYRQQHDSREIGNHQTDGDGKGLVEEDRSCYSAHEHKWNEDGNCRKSGTQHRSNYFGRPFIASLFQRVSSCPVLGNVFRYDDRTVDHHTQSQDQPGDGDDIQRHLAEVEKKETDDQATTILNPITAGLLISPKKRMATIQMKRKPNDRFCFRFEMV